MRRACLILFHLHDMFLYFAACSIDGPKFLSLEERDLISDVR
jgi:hypothetical protein